MKYITIIVSTIFTLSVLSENLNGQVSDDVVSSSDPAASEQSDIEQDTVSTEELGKLINLTYNSLSDEDKPGTVVVLNPDEFIHEAYNVSPYDVINARVGGLINPSSIWGLGGALVLIDGIPRSMSDIRLEEIEQISVLKGVNAVALYGSHAANGVILITTKRGSSSKQEVKVRIDGGIGLPKQYPEYLNSADYMTLYNEARVNDGLEPLYTDEQILYSRTGDPYRYPDVDFYSPDYLAKYMNFKGANSEFVGGNEDAKFYANLGWLNSTSLLNIGEGKNERDNQFNARGNIDLRINDFITSTIDVSTIIGNSRRGHGGYWSGASAIHPNKFSPLVPLDYIHPDSTDALTLGYNSKHITDGRFVPGGSLEYQTNPISSLLYGGYTNIISRTLMLTNTINFDLDGIVEGLSFHTLVSADYDNIYAQSIDNQYATYAPVWDSVPGSTTILDLQKFNEDKDDLTQNLSGSTQSRNLAFSAFFRYAKSIDGLHNFSGILLANGNYRTVNNVYQPYTNSNLGLQLAYNFRHKYWVDLSSALVNSTKLPDNNRAAVSPTISFGWLMSNEAFLSNASAIDYLKFSVAAGILNTDNYIGDYYLYDNTYESIGWLTWHDDAYNNSATASQQGSNPDLTFSKRKEVSATLEGSFFNKLLWVETSFFSTTIDGLPARRFTEYPSYYSAFVPYTNYNVDRYTGMDFMLNLHKQFGDLELDLGVNGTFVSSEVITRDELFNNEYQYRTGKPVDAMFGLESDGFFDSDAEIEAHAKQVFGEVQPGDIKYVDQNGDGVVDENDAIEIGRWGSPFKYAMNVSATYKNVTLFIQGIGRHGGNGLKSNNYYWVDGDDKYSVVVNDRWTEDTRNTATYPRLSSLGNNNNFRSSDFWVYESNLFNISLIQLSYNLPESAFGDSFIKGFGIYLNASNVALISKNKDILELTVGGSPDLRAFAAGVRANF